MKEKTLYGIWGFLFILCAGLGFIPEPAGFGKAVLVAAALLFFVPGAMLLVNGLQTRNRKAVLRIRLISACSLGLTLVLLVANVLSVNASQTVGNILYWLLILVSSPMICGQYWLLSLFLWACLLTASFLRPARH